MKLSQLVLVDPTARCFDSFYAQAVLLESEELCEGSVSLYNTEEGRFRRGLY